MHKYLFFRAWSRESLYLWGAVISFVLIIIIAKSAFIFTNPGYSYTRFSNEIKNESLNLKSEVKKFMAGIDSSEGFSGVYGYSFPSLPNESNYALLLVRNDSVVWWNSSRESFGTDDLKRIPQGVSAMRLPTGWSMVFRQTTGKFSFLGFRMISRQYPVNNDYLKNGPARGFTLPAGMAITADLTGYPLFSYDGKYLFSLDPHGNETKKVLLTGERESILPGLTSFVLFIVGVYLLIGFILALVGRTGLTGKGSIVRPVMLTLLLVTARVIQYYSGFPANLFPSGIFGPGWYSSSRWISSAGDLLAYSLALLWILREVRNTLAIRQRQLPAKPGFLHYPIAALLIFLALLLYNLAIEDLLRNSSLFTVFSEFSGVGAGDAIGFLIIGCYAIIAFTVMSGLAGWMEHREPRGVMFPASLLFFIAAVSLLIPVAGMLKTIVLAAGTILFLAGYRLMKSAGRPGWKIQQVLILLAFYSLTGAFSIHQANKERESIEAELFALKLVNRHNPLVEERFSESSERIRNDTAIRRMAEVSGMAGENHDMIENYLRTTYFGDFWRRYNIQFTLCRQGEELRIEPRQEIIGCRDYFTGMIDAYGEPTSDSGLMFLNYGFGNEYYLGMIGLSRGSARSENDGIYLYVEFFLNTNYPDPGYPGLLIDSESESSPSSPGFSHAIYRGGKLIYSYGEANYEMSPDNYRNINGTEKACLFGGFRNYAFRITGDTDIVVSRKYSTLLALATPFSALYLFFSGIVLSLVLFRLATGQWKPSVRDLRTKLHLALSGMLIFTMILAGIIQIMNIKEISETKNLDYLREKAYSILTEIRHKYGHLENETEMRTVDPATFLVKLSNVFFTDINLFDTGGKLVASSRQKIFSEGLLSDRMDPVACSQMISGSSSLLIQQERIGDLTFGTVYLPVYNDRGIPLGFINLPYFARQDELNREIAGFLVTYVNVFIFLVILGLLISVFLSGYVTRPLLILSEKMARLRLGNVNDKIDWKKEDEIGRLVKAYNRMVQELARSAEQLALSEREGAWRAMARQVAHEIRNPLTPMKLSAQYLQKSWNEKVPDIDKRITRFTETLVEQIDALSAIASDFSEFARMSPPEKEKINLTRLVSKVISWYSDTAGIEFVFDHPGKDCFIMADEARLTRVLTNLTNNAVHAIGNKSNGQISYLVFEDTDLILQISDNGSGIPEGQVSKIFQPDFTTRAGGMGLGLAIVKGIITEMGGEISFSSVENRGSTFTIRIPGVVV